MGEMAKKSILAFFLLGLLGLALAVLPVDRPRSGGSAAPPVTAAEEERLEAGRLSYRVHCASCHGEGGRGDGPMAGVLKIRPTDLTRLAARHRGRFPREEVIEAIDGRREVRGHGTSSMPVWGITLQVQGKDTPQEQEVEERILDLVAYLESIQRERRW